MLEYARTASSACVIDLRLALGAFGLLSMARLACSWDLWVCSRVRDALRTPPPSPSCFVLNPEDSQEVTDLRESIALLARTPFEPDLMRVPLYSVGDRVDESRLPAHVDHGLHTRYDQLRGGMDLLRSHDSSPTPIELMECFCDTIALAGALSAWQVFVLTRVEVGKVPAICHTLARWQVRVKRVRAEGTPMCRELRAKLGALTSVVPFAAVHVLPKGLPVLGGALPNLDTEAVASRWRRSEVCWHPIGGCA